MKDLARETYRNRRGNCAQAVSLAWTEHTGQHRDLSEGLASCGGGKAPDGWCGAIHAVRCIAPESLHDDLTRAFAEATGGELTCKGIRGLRKLACPDCVATAASLLEPLKESGQA